MGLQIYIFQEAAAAVNGLALKDPRRGSLDRKASTTLNIIPDLDARKLITPVIIEDDDTYMAAANVGGGSKHSAQVSMGGGLAISSQPPVDDDDTYMDGISLRMPSTTSLDAPALPASRPPSLISSEIPTIPVIESHSMNLTANSYSGPSLSMTQPSLYDNPLHAEFLAEEENLYIDHDELVSSRVEDDDIYSAPPTIGVDVHQVQSFAPPIPQRAPQNIAPVSLPPRNVPPRPRPS